MPVAIKIGNAHYCLPTLSRKSRSKGAVHMRIVAHIPYRGLTCARVVKQIVWMAVVIEVTWPKYKQLICAVGGSGAVHRHHPEMAGCIHRQAVDVRTDSLVSIPSLGLGGSCQPISRRCSVLKMHGRC